jgi:hypothetical protein
MHFVIYLKSANVLPYIPQVERVEFMNYLLSHTPEFGHSKNQTYFSHVFLEVFLWNQLERSMTGCLSESRFG